MSRNRDWDNSPLYSNPQEEQRYRECHEPEDKSLQFYVFGEKEDKAFNIPKMFEREIPEGYKLDSGRWLTKKEDPMYGRFKKMDIAGERDIALFSPEYMSIQVGFCTKCKEWTEVGNSCCGESYVQID